MRRLNATEEAFAPERDVFFAVVEWDRAEREEDGNPRRFRPCLPKSIEVSVE